MPVIPTQVSQVAMQPYQATGVQLDNSVGEGLEQLGRAIGNVGSGFERQKERDRKKADQDAWIRMQGLNEDLNQDLTVIDRDAPADGTGLATTFDEKALTPKTTEFLASIQDPEVRKEYEARLEVLGKKWRNEAIDKEYNRGQAHSLNVLADAQQEKVLGIVQEPQNFEAYVSDYEKQIDDAPNLTTEQRETAKRKWRQTAPAILSEQLKVTDPDTLYFATGHGTPDERRTYVAKSVVAAVAKAETAGGDDLVSRKGALGRMQIMPDTAVEIARDLKDERFLSMDAEARERYLLREDVSYRYGEHYLGKMLKKNGGNLTLALIAYNAGQKRANEFVAKNGDWSKMGSWSKETQPYVDKIMGYIGTKRFAANVGVPRSENEQSLAGGRRIPFKFENEPGRQPVDTDVAHLDKGMVEKWERVQGAFGRQLPVVSGYRSPEVNEAAGGASSSRHMHGDAIDVSVKGLTKADRLKLIELASAAGFTGIGVYNTSLHFDTREARKSWGPNHSITSLPEWAAPTIKKHLAGGYGSGAGTTIVSGSGGAGVPGPGGAGGVRFKQGAEGLELASDDADDQPFINDAFRGLDGPNLINVQNDGTRGVKQKTEAEKLAEATLKVQTADRVTNDVASMLQTGKGSILPGDMEQFQQDLMISNGPDAVAHWARDRARAQTIFTMTEGLESMSSSQLDGLADLKPSGGTTAADQQYVHEEVVKRIDAEKKRRHDDPGLAIQNLPGLKERLAAVQANPKDPDVMQDYFDGVIAAQRSLGMDEALLPKAKAEALGKQIKTVIKMNPDQAPDDLTKAFLQDLEQTFGGYADEIFMQSMETILDKDISKETRGLMSSTMLEWIKETPGANDPNYRRLKSKYNWSYAPEFAAQDKVKLEEADDGVKADWSTPAGAGKAVRQWIKGPPPAQPIAGAAARTPIPGSERTSAIANTRFKTRVSGVPDAALDQLVNAPQDPKVQAAFRKQFGEVSFGEAQKFLKQQAPQ